MFKKRLQVFRSFLLLNDLLVLTICWFGAFYLRFFAPLVPVTKGIPPLREYLFFFPFVLLTCAVTFYLTGIYTRFYNRTQEGVALLKASFVSLMILVFITFFFKRTDYSRLVFLYFSLLGYAGLVLTRIFLKKYYVTLQRRYFDLEQVLIVGARELAQRVAQTINQHPELGLVVSGFLSRIPQKIGTRIEGLEVLGLYEDIDRVIREKHVNLVIFAMPLTAQQKLESLLNQIRDELVDIKIVPDLYRLITLRGGVEEFEGLPFINLRESPMVGWSRFFKRAVDFGLAALVLILLFPCLLLIGLAIKVSSPGPVLYRQIRMGLDGKVFEMWKFRSMVVDAEEKTGPVWARKGDPGEPRSAGSSAASAWMNCPNWSMS